ncbi:hypothetical protein TNCT_301241 [Trichonephila clavata]|uniref:Uncharacterized protein n=1 Tax=Trichonephila clavata TaxID=2740835 RepID=A0A8X6J347_TRICU|nr:hypothetical protein TNCT_301241 [Trichonephila clavata]
MHQPLYMTVFRGNMIPTGTATKMNQFPIAAAQATRIVHRNQLTSFETRGRTHVYIPVINLSTVNMRQTLVHDSFLEEI